MMRHASHAHYQKEVLCCDAPCSLQSSGQNLALATSVELRADILTLV